MNAQENTVEAPKQLGRPINPERLKMVVLNEQGQLRTKGKPKNGIYSQVFVRFHSFNPTLPIEPQIVKRGETIVINRPVKVKTAPVITINAGTVNQETL